MGVAYTIKKLLTKALCGVFTAAIAVCLIAFAAPEPFRWDRGGDYTGPIHIRQCSAPGSAAEECDTAVLDYSNLPDGYVMVKKLTPLRVKVIVTDPQGKRDTRWELQEENVFYPVTLNGGSGEYTFQVMLHVSGMQYMQVLSVSLFCNTGAVDGLYLLPNVFANYDEYSEAVKLSFDLCLNAENDLEKVQSIYGYITETIQYDSGFSPPDNYVPNSDETLRRQKGQCFDFASLIDCYAAGAGGSHKTGGRVREWPIPRLE